MTFKQLLQACSKGTMPRVTYTKSGVTLHGIVTTIKDQAETGVWRGCAVRFPSVTYDVWFTDSEQTDGRTKYMRQLVLVEADEITINSFEHAEQTN